MKRSAEQEGLEVLVLRAARLGDLTGNVRAEQEGLEVLVLQAARLRNFIEKLIRSLFCFLNKKFFNFVG